VTDPTPKPGDGKFSVATGVGWTTLGQFGVQGINFASSLALTLFLDPADFGLVGFGYAVLAVVDMLVDFGIGSAIVQRKELGPRTVDVAFTINVLLAVAATSLIALFGGGLWLLGGDWQADAVMLWWLAPSCLFTAVVTMPRALLTRALRLDAIAKVLLGSAVVRAVASLGAAALGSGPYALVIGGYAGAVALVLMLRRHEHSRMRWCWNTPERPELLAFGVRLTMFNLVNTVLMNADAFVLKPLLGSEAFGLFALARRLLFQPVEMAGNVARSVLFPMLARVQHRRARARWLYLRADQLLLAGMLPLLVACGAAGRPADRHAAVRAMGSGRRDRAGDAAGRGAQPAAAESRPPDDRQRARRVDAALGRGARCWRCSLPTCSHRGCWWRALRWRWRASCCWRCRCCSATRRRSSRCRCGHSPPAWSRCCPPPLLLPARCSSCATRPRASGTPWCSCCSPVPPALIAWLLVTAVLTKAPFVAFLRRQWQRRRSRRGR
jgi:hypothetical protein